MAYRQKIVRSGLGFLFGVFSASLEWNFYLTFFLAIIFWLILGLIKKSDRPYSNILKNIRIGAELFILSLALGFFYYHFFLNFTNLKENISLEEKVVVDGIIAKNPEEKETYQKLTFELQPPLRGKILVLTEPLVHYEYGDKVKIEGKIEESQFENQPPISFFPKIEVTAKNQGGWLKTNLYKLKNHLTGQFKRQLSPDKAALVSGITFGERSEFSQEFKNDMARSGVTHIVALSGYNIAILVLAIERSLRKIISRQKRFYFTLVLIFLFVLMVGGEASVVRAATMGSLILLAGHLGRPHDTLHIIILTAIAMVLVNPTILVFDIGFQLSFLSLLGIIRLEPVLKRFFGVEDKKKESFLAWRENSITTLAAQLAVIPVLIMNFDQFSLTGVIANALILVTVPFTMFLGFLLAVLSSISFFLGFFVAQLVSLLTSYQIAVIEIFSFIYLPLPGSQFLKTGVVFIIYYTVLLILAFRVGATPVPEKKKVG